MNRVDIRPIEQWLARVPIPTAIKVIGISDGGVPGVQQRKSVVPALDAIRRLLAPI